jgi:hypothetical protein
VAGSRKIAALADTYATGLAAHERNYTLVAPVPLAWLRARPLVLDAPRGQALVLAFDRRPPPVHEASPNLVVSLKDVVGWQPFEEPEGGGEEEGEAAWAAPDRNGCLRLPTTVFARCVFVLEERQGVVLRWDD